MVSSDEADENPNEPVDLYSYMESHFAFETVDVSPTPEASSLVDDHFKLYDNTLATISLSNPYEYTVDNSRVYDFTIEEEAAMKRKFDAVSVSLQDVIEMGNREYNTRYQNRVIYVPLEMQKIKKKRKKAKKANAAPAVLANEQSSDIILEDSASNIKKPIDKKDRRRKKRPSQKKRIVLKKIKSGILNDFNLKPKSKVWKLWVNK